MQYVGNPYVYGGNSLTNGVDCSGFVNQVYGAMGYNVARSSSELRNEGTEVSYADAQPGDVVFYSDGGTGYQHYAIYLGGEMSLQGNWLGTTVIRSVYINGSAPQFRRCSGH